MLGCLRTVNYLIPYSFFLTFPEALRALDSTLGK